MTKETEYHEMKAEVSLQIEHLKRRDRWFSVWRLVYFIGLAALLILCYQISLWLGIVLTYLGIYGFYVLILRHQVLRKKMATTENRLKLIEAELVAIDYRFDFFNAGTRFDDPKHPYASDLDLFGSQGIFPLISRCVTLDGSARLAHILKNGFPYEKLSEISQAIRALEHHTEWRQQFFAIGQTDIGQHVDFQYLRRWLASGERHFSFSWWFIVIPLVCWVAFIWLLTLIPWHIALLAFVPTALMALLARKRVDELHGRLSDQEKYVLMLEDVIRHLQNARFENDHLTHLMSPFHVSDNTATVSLWRLRYILSQLNIRYNAFGILLNLVTLWDHHWAIKLEGWKNRYSERALLWMNRLAEIEMLSSLANFAYNHSHYTYADYRPGKVLDGKEMVHPLVHREKVVPNDFHLKLGGQVQIITGSNMGGKSTYLRTCAINIVLARCGTRVGARELTLPDVKVITSMRTQDALQENVSSFYAELLRLKMVLTTVEEDPSTIFFLDEVLKGTNTKDRHEGAKALIKKLLEYNGSGLISTHDLALGHWADSTELDIKNYCFEVEVEDDQMQFDYKKRSGVSKSFNASALMKNMGIDL